MNNEEKLNNKYSYGQQMINKKALSGKPKVAYIVTHTAGYDTLVKMSPKLPYIPGKDDHFFVHINKLLLLWHRSDEMVQKYLRERNFDFEVNVMSRSMNNLKKGKGEFKIYFSEYKECEVTERTAGYFTTEKPKKKVSEPGIQLSII